MEKKLKKWSYDSDLQKLYCLGRRILIDSVGLRWFSFCNVNETETQTHFMPEKIHSVISVPEISLKKGLECIYTKHWGSNGCWVNTLAIRPKTKERALIMEQMGCQSRRGKWYNLKVTVSHFTGYNGICRQEWTCQTLLSCSWIAPNGCFSRFRPTFRREAMSVRGTVTLKALS